MKEFWTKVWTDVEVSNLGGLRVDMKDLLEQAGRKNDVAFPFKKLGAPVKVRVKVKQYNGNYNNKDKKKKVICLDNNQVFESLTAACVHYSLSSTKLCNCLKGRTPDIDGLRWAYYTE